jgi:DNA-binding transcriptional LysR family regulator
MLFGYGRRMELRHLRYFVAVAEELNLTRAAAKLRVAQPALSRQIKDLEGELSAPLFERTRTGVQLTRAGRAFYPRARAVLKQTAEAVNDARTAGGAISGRLAVGYENGMLLNELAPVIATFRRTHSKVELDFFYGKAPEQLKALRDTRIDLATMNLFVPTDGLEHQTVLRVPVEVVLPARHPLAKQAEFTLAELRNEEFVLCTRESRPEFYDEFFRRCANAGFHPHIVKEVGGHPSNMLGLVSVGVGVSVYPHFNQVERMHGIVWRPLVKPATSVDFAFVWRAKAVPPVVQEFIAAVEKKLPQPDHGESGWA